MPTPRFPPEALTFLRGLKRNNRRDWFNARRDKYEAYVRQPMIAFIERLGEDLREFAPDIVANPKTSMFRIYRDIRFAENKAPYKTHVAASFPTRGLPKHTGAGLYFHVSPDEVWIGGGLHSPGTPQLQAIREHIAANLNRLRTIVDSPGFRRTVGRLEGERLLRVPRGFPKDHKAAEFLRYRQYLAGCEVPPALATSPKLYPKILNVFKQVAPLVRFLNEPLVH